MQSRNMFLSKLKLKLREKFIYKRDFFLNRGDYAIAYNQNCNYGLYVQQHAIYRIHITFN